MEQNGDKPFFPEGFASGSEGQPAAEVPCRFLYLRRQRLHRTLYHIYSNALNPCAAPSESNSRATTLSFCAECRWPQERLEGIDVTVAARPTSEPLNCFFAPWLGLAHQRFFEQLGTGVVAAHLHLGRVFDRNGRLIDDWVTYRGKHLLVVRGVGHVGSRTCETCGRNLYFATGQRYLHPAPRADIPLFQSDLLGLIMPAELLKQVALRREMRRNVRIERLPVLDSPPDGLGEIPFFADRR